MSHKAHDVKYPDTQLRTSTKWFRPELQQLENKLIKPYYQSAKNNIANYAHTL